MSHNLFDGWIYALTAKVCWPSIFTRDEMPVCISPHNHKLKTSTSMHHKSQDQTTVWISLQKLNSRKNRPLANFINLPACKVTDTFLKTKLMQATMADGKSAGENKKLRNQNDEQKRNWKTAGLNNSIIPPTINVSSSIIHGTTASSMHCRLGKVTPHKINR